MSIRSTKTQDKIFLKINNIFLIVILSLFTLLGCESKEIYSFENPEVKAYINKEAIEFDLDMDDFIEIKTSYMKAVIKSYEIISHDVIEKDFVENDFTYETYLKMIEVEFAEINYSIAEKYLNYHKEELKRDYLISLYLYHYNYDNDENFKDMIEKLLQVHIDDAMKQKNPFIITGVEFDTVSWLKEISAEKDIPYDECIEKIYKPFIITLSLLEIPFKGFVEKHYSGKIIESKNLSDFSDLSKEESADMYRQTKLYTENINDILRQYYDYIGEMIGESDIVLPDSQ